MSVLVALGVSLIQGAAAQSPSQPSAPTTPAVRDPAYARDGDIGYPRHHDPDYYRWTARAAQEMLAPLTLVSTQRIKELYSYDDEHDVILKHYATIWEKA